MNRVPGLLEPLAQFFEFIPPIRTRLCSGFESRGHLFEVFNIFSNRLLFLPNFVETMVYALGQSAKLLFREPPFFSSKFRWIESRTSPKASAIRKPGGRSGPP